MSSNNKKANRWALVDQSFLSLYITFSLIELTNIGSGIIDGLVVSNFFDSDSLAAVGIASPMFDVERYIAQALDRTDKSAKIRFGLKIISGLAGNISYVHSLENNNVIIRFPNH